MHSIGFFSSIFAVLIFSCGVSMADGCFVFKWNKEKDINEPTQKAIILHDKGREDLVLQVRYEGPAEEFGWLVPVPSLPEVRKGSMECFYELSRLTQLQAAVTHGMAVESVGAGRGEDDSVNVIKVETVGAYEVSILSAGSAAKLTEWLDAYGFSFPKEKQEVLDSYIKKGWYFMAAKIDPNRNGFAVLQGKMDPAKKPISPSTRQQLASGELHPLMISFDSEKCVFPLAISAVNSKPSEVSLYVLSSEPLMSPTIFDMQFVTNSKARQEWVQQATQRRKQIEERLKESDQRRDELIAGRRTQLSANQALAGRFQSADDPADPQPPFSKMRELTGTGLRMAFDDLDDYYSGDQPLLFSISVQPKDLAVCAKELPRLQGKSWWLTKQVQIFAPSEMRDLEFEPAVPFLTALLHKPDGLAQGYACLRQFGARAVPLVVAGMKSPDSEERRFAASIAAQMKDPQFTPAALSLLDDKDPRTRANACYTLGNNWDDAVASRLAERLGDSREEVRMAARTVLLQHPDEKLLPAYKKMVEDDTAAAGNAIQLLHVENYPRKELIRLFSSTNLPVVSTAFTRLRYALTVDEVEPLLANPLPMARLMGLGELDRLSSKPSMDRMVAMLHDSNEYVRWRVRSDLRRLTGQKLGADPAAYEQWWKQNRETFTPPPPDDRRPRRPIPQTVEGN